MADVASVAGSVERVKAETISSKISPSSPVMQEGGRGIQEEVPPRSFRDSDPVTQLKSFELRYQGPSLSTAIPENIKSIIRDKASIILETGNAYLGSNDYMARLEAFSDILTKFAKQDPQYSKALMGELFIRDPEALGSWLNPDLIHRAVDEGKISPEQRAQIAENFASIYNAGHLALEPKKVEGVLDNDAFESPIDEHLFNFKTIFGLYDDQHSEDDHAKAARRIDAFIGFINSSQGPEATRFKVTYSRHLIEHYTLLSKKDRTDRTLPQGHQSIAAGLAANLLADCPNPRIVVDFFSQYTPKELEHVFAEISLSQDRFSTKQLSNEHNRFETQFVHDGLSLVMSSVSKVRGPEAKRLALEMTHWFIENENKLLDPNDRLSGMEKNPVYVERVSALGEMVVGHAKPIFDRYSYYDETSLGNDSGYTERQYHLNAKNLATLFRHTLLSSSCRSARALGHELIHYSRTLKTKINQAEDQGYDEAASRLGMLSAALDDAISQVYQKNKEENESLAQIAAFTIDLALSAVPASLRPDKIIQETLKSLPKTRRNEVLQGLGKFAVDFSTGRLNSKVKKTLVELVGSDQADLISQEKYRDVLRASLFAGFAHDSRMRTVRNQSDSILNALEDMER